MTTTGRIGAAGATRSSPDAEHVEADDGDGGVVVRQALPADLDIVLALRLALLREHAGNAVYGRLHPDAPDRARRLFAEQLASPAETVYLAERDGATVGVLRCAESTGSPLLHPARYAYISSVYVRPEARRGGVLHALMHAAEEWARARGLREMRLHNAADNPLADAAWEALGFDVVEVLRVRAVDAARPDVRRRLTPARTADT